MEQATPIEPYLNMVLRRMTPNRLNPPKPMTIALSELLVLLQGTRVSRNGCSHKTIPVR